MSGRARAAAVGAAALMLAAAPAVAHAAGLAGAASGGSQVGTAVWAALPTQAAGPPYPTGPLTLTFTGPGQPAPQYFSVVNVGTIALTGASYTATASGKSIATLSACVGGTWNQTTGSCNGGRVSILTGASTVAPAAPGSALVVQCAVKVKGGTPVTVSVSVSVDNATDIRPPQTVNS